MGYGGVHCSAALNGRGRVSGARENAKTHSNRNVSVEGSGGQCSPDLKRIRARNHYYGNLTMSARALLNGFSESLNFVDFSKSARILGSPHAITCANNIIGLPPPPNVSFRVRAADNFI